jgi:glycosyltransferase involved in cell wall biosynthesis
MTARRKIIMIGPVPPPTGGVSIHIWRLFHLLKEDFDIDFVDEFKVAKKEYFNLRSFNLFKYLGILGKGDIVFIHSGTNVLRMGHIIASKLLGKKTVLTLHAYPGKKPLLIRKLHEFIFGLADKIIIVNADFKERINLPNEKVVVKHAFLPPIISEEKELPNTVQQWIDDGRQKKSVIICSNAWRLDIWNNQDLYGVDMCIEVTKRLVKKGIPVTFIFNVATTDKSVPLYEDYKKQINNSGLEKNFHLANEQLSFVKLMQQADLVVRPTNTDGDSLSIREALYLGKPIITSDVVIRPEGSILHKNRDIDDFEQKITESIQTAPAQQNLNGQHQDLSYYSFYKDIFVNLFK